MLKRILCLLLAFLCVVSVVGCNNQPSDNTGDTEPNETEPQTPNQDQQEGDDTVAIEKSGIILTDEFSFVAKNEGGKLRREVELTKISEIDEKYVKTSDGYYYVLLDSPYFELGGATFDEKGKVVRLASEVSDSDYAKNNAGVTIRFCTTASSIRVRANVSRAYKSDTTVPRGSYGFDFYVGSGTDRIETGDYLQKYAATNLDSEIPLAGGGTKEVLIYLPQLANLESLMIGFNSKIATIAPPLPRDHAPVVFYGSGITQGLEASRPGNTYANIVTRMLNTDCINFGMIDGAHGESAIAEYIASLEDISAFVMEFDHGATLDELKANHYNFYKTVRDAHPDIPIIIMNDPVLCAADKTEREERVAVIAETYNKALAAGDAKVWLLDGEDIFPTDDMLDLYTVDLETLNNTGHFYLATCIYDVLNSAFTPDEEKSGIEREVGYKDPFEYELYSYDDKIMDAEYTAVSALDEAYVKSSRDGVSYLTLSTPQFELGGLIHPDDNQGEFYRVPYERKDEFLSNLLESAYSSLLNHTSGGTVRFRTNTHAIVVKATLENMSGGEHGSSMGFNGLEVYVGTGNDRVYCEARGQALVGNTFSEVVHLPEGYKEVMITLPNYSGIKELTIGIPADAEIAEPTERDHAPILYYGTSITQGACASRSWLGFANLTARWLNTDLIHLGFSGSGRGEQIMADYIASYANDISAFVMNYDGNSSEAEMRERCYPVYKTVRDANPDLPIFLMSAVYANDVRPDYREECYKIMKETYDRAVAEGDTNVYLIDCRDVFPEDIRTLRDICVVDYCHLTDTGMYYAAREIYDAVKKVLVK